MAQDAFQKFTQFNNFGSTLEGEIRSNTVKIAIENVYIGVKYQVGKTLQYCTFTRQFLVGHVTSELIGIGHENVGFLGTTE